MKALVKVEVLVEVGVKGVAQRSEEAANSQVLREAVKRMARSIPSAAQGFQMQEVSAAETKREPPTLVAADLRCPLQHQN
jgi:hypothetical protein